MLGNILQHLLATYAEGFGYGWLRNWHWRISARPIWKKQKKISWLTQVAASHHEVIEKIEKSGRGESTTAPTWSVSHALYFSSLLLKEQRMLSSSLYLSIFLRLFFVSFFIFLFHFIFSPFFSFVLFSSFSLTGCLRPQRSRQNQSLRINNVCRFVGAVRMFENGDQFVTGSDKMKERDREREREREKSIAGLGCVCYVQ